jgi:hypothetical protein
MKTITAKYTGTCAATGARILAGDLIQWSKGRAVLLERRRAVLLERRRTAVDTITLYGEHGPNTYYQNARGRCIDAPCCGCCTL